MEIKKIQIDLFWTYVSLFKRSNIFFASRGFLIDSSPKIDTGLKCYAIFIVPIACGFLINGNGQFKVAQGKVLIKRFLTTEREAFQGIA